jgi:hypothetical protein
MARLTIAVIVVIVALSLVTITVGFVGYTNTNNLQTDYDKLKIDLNNLNSSYISLLGNFNSLTNQFDARGDSINNLQAQISSLNEQTQSLSSQLATAQGTVQSQSSTISSQSSQISSLQGQVSSLNSNIANLQTQLANATALIAQLQGPTGILPTYSDLNYIGPSYSGGAYWLTLTLKNTGPIPVTQVFVTINSNQVNIPFTYLNATVSSSNPLPAYQTCTGRLNVTPPINNAGTYPLVIQAVASNSTVYTYQTTIVSH